MSDNLHKFWKYSVFKPSESKIVCVYINNTVAGIDLSFGGLSAGNCTLQTINTNIGWNKTSTTDIPDEIEPDNAERSYKILPIRDTAGINEGQGRAAAMLYYLAEGTVVRTRPDGSANDNFMLLREDPMSYENNTLNYLDYNNENISGKTFQSCKDDAYKYDKHNNPMDMLRQALKHPPAYFGLPAFIAKKHNPFSATVNYELSDGAILKIGTQIANDEESVKDEDRAATIASITGLSSSQYKVSVHTIVHWKQAQHWEDHVVVDIRPA